MRRQSDGPVTVAQLTQYIKNLFAADSQLNSLRVSGEISNFKHHSSGHMYFTLKDAKASLRCVMFRSYNARLTFKPTQGMNVVVSGRISVYERDGQYQMYVENMLPEGVGSLFAAFEALKKRLAAEGLFAPEKKKQLPKLPTRIGVVTSPTGAAIRDILTTLKRRFPQAEVLVMPVLVQGPDAPEQIAEAIEFLNNIDDVDVMIIGRGGGAIEELWAFNEEVVARAVYASDIPVVSAVGHETDFTIADFVADVRAATPTAAAEIVVPDQREIMQYLDSAKQRMAAKLAAKLEHDRRYLERLASSRVLTRPLERLEQYSQVLDNLSARLETRMQYLLQGCQSRVSVLEGKLTALSPEAVLARGFAICLDEKGNVVRDAALLNRDDLLKLRLQRGTVTARVEETDTEEVK
ncbi:exodeoxyribonuclease VII large subunit [Dethiobacter alkaliphilus]|uniref:Exodeoxyribonuclease 7 large subunit n=1 Tax=Dethiobacter alkaliphilus AHT 1 TaxID=555088 RepID=C0GE26_DETAL|nr:exodeoxyribonuclease VII large subunit [Dethiobacter alkaliphilus]EEG78320.1 exodeoxyribonuclease VII, large subunit [Dethiobacter alkaliphilus AHT 1]